MKIAPSDASYKTFCDITTAYRLAAVVTHSVRSGVIAAAGGEGCSAAEIMAASGMRIPEGERFLALLVNLGILEKYAGRFQLSQFSRTYLSGSSETGQLPVLEFERLLIDKWDKLGTVLCQGQGSVPGDSSDDAYRQRLDLFQKAMRAAGAVRSEELWDAFPLLPEAGLIIDLGAGDGTYLKNFIKRHPGWQAVACDLGEVVDQIRDPAITNHACNLINPQELETLVASYKNRASIVLISNLLHCYSHEENATLLGRIADLAGDDGLLVVHDFFTDGNSFGALYDAHMLINTYSGRCFSFAETAGLLGAAGFSHSAIIELPSYSHAILAARRPHPALVVDPLFLLRQKALAAGFFEAAALEPGTISGKPWVKAKCRYGCSHYGRTWSCPPHSMDSEEFRELLDCYSKAILVAGQPPLKQFQQNLLELEKYAFLQGFKKALVFSAGPCSWCEQCADERCRSPEKRRPSLESCGVDVFELAESCRMDLKPLKTSADFVKYIGLLLIE